MPPLQPAPGVARVAFEGTTGVTNWACIMHVVQPDATGSAYNVSSWTQPDIIALSSVMRTSWGTRFAPRIATASVLQTTTCIDLTNDSGVVAVDTVNIPGTFTGTVLPAQVSCCVSWKESFHYRGGHPRTYLPPTTQTAQATNNQWSSTYANGTETAALNFLADLTSDTSVSIDGLQLIGLHRVSQGATLADPLVKFITGASVDLRIDTQRRRLGPDV